MAESTTEYGILVGVDGSAESDAAVRWASREAVMRAERITLMHVVGLIPDWPSPSRQAQISAQREQNAGNVIEQAHKAVLASVTEPQSLDLRTEVIHSDIVRALVSASAQATMTVAGSRGMDAFGRFLLGSVSNGLLHHAYGAVAIIRDDDAMEVDQNAPVLVGIDGSAASEAATALAFDEASLRGVPLVALHAWSDVGVFPILGMDWRDYEAQGERVLAKRLTGWQERYPDVKVHRRLVCDKPARWLLEESRRAQLVVVGSCGRGGFPGKLLGSVSSAVAHSAEVPVIVVRPRLGEA
ncbi:universal stress protein [Mycobacterium noviomagense]|uniref:Universal stress protein n=1 Tax=Mycobacterium noviomagense TaxID=459858 RepID=A0A7I7PI26_9MYCO|nr:universal stress protein [Mycobacterium noviomagense]ORB11209.1 universal stress protein [Mycobacterium noviomagense]BBY08236.1 universal stress protein [Mycobacterium noviomagense]